MLSMTTETTALTLGAPPQARLRHGAAQTGQRGEAGEAARGREEA